MVALLLSEGADLHVRDEVQATLTAELAKKQIKKYC